MIPHRIRHLHLHGLGLDLKLENGEHVQEQPGLKRYWNDQPLRQIPKRPECAAYHRLLELSCMDLGHRHLPIAEAGQGALSHASIFLTIKNKCQRQGHGIIYVLRLQLL